MKKILSIMVLVGITILADLKLDYPSVEMELTPIDEFLDENWIKPEEW